MEKIKKIEDTKEEVSTQGSKPERDALGDHRLLSVECLISYHLQARRVFDEEEIQQLSSTIKEHGIQNPLLVMVSPSKKDKFEVISGERRLRAARLIGMKELPCLIIEGERASEIALIENIQRSDLHPVDMGDALNTLLKKSKWGDVTKLAEKLGKSQSSLSNYLSYSKIPESIKKHLLEKNITSQSTLRALLKCNTLDEMKKLLNKESSSKGLAPKSVLRISLDADDIKMQSRSIERLSSDQREKVKKVLYDIIQKIEDLNKQP